MKIRVQIETFPESSCAIFEADIEDARNLEKLMSVLSALMTAERLMTEYKVIESQEGEKV